ncbi:hypothetical protein P256_00629 [Acinetobacter nectaris CIP 110549]|uniref:DUF2946 domain-containing protein n=1 Tax=Acinetobacter nectaris CIP 110549 TaxID=1392540 RepID=V2TC25_9GAMM|nr:DUF2946 family protein [Acinetobacter nectaris]ESK40188.1 hypothetical protein P256_00629 [Acinetobacter nectaris CIP 110549]
MSMRKLALSLATIALIFQSLVFWQVFMPKSMHMNAVCIEIQHATQHMDKHKKNMLSSMESKHTFTLDDCHFCQVFSHVYSTPTFSPQLITNKIQVKLLFLAELTYIFLYLRQLLLFPQSRAPPLLI